MLPSSHIFSSVETKKWGDAVKRIETTPKVPNYENPQFWGHACHDTESSEAAEDFVCLSLLDTIMEALQEIKAPMHLAKENDHITWEWAPSHQSSADQWSFLQTQGMTSIIEGVRRFQSIMSEMEGLKKPEKMSEPKAIMASSRMQMVSKIIEECKTLSNTGNPDHLKQIENLLSLLLTCGLHLKSSFSSAEFIKEDLEQQTTYFLEDALNEALPLAFQITWDEDENVNMQQSAAWEEGKEPGNGPLLLWNFKHAILPAVIQGITFFEQKITPTPTNGTKAADMMPAACATALQKTKEALAAFQREVDCAMKSIFPTHADEEAFRTHVKLKHDLEREQASMSPDRHDYDRLQVLWSTHRALKEEMKNHSEETEMHRRYLLGEWNSFLDALKLNPVDAQAHFWEGNPDLLSADAQPVNLPQFLPGLPDIFSPPDLRGIEAWQFD